MKIVLIASNYYPINDVSSIRIHSYCKALADSGVDITVLIVYNYNDLSLKNNGEFEGVNYRFVSQLNSKGLFAKLYSRISGLFNIRKEFLDRNVDYVLSYHDNLISNIFIKLCLLGKRIPYIIDKTEYPYGYYKMNKFKRIITDLNLRLFDGFIVISNELKNFYKSYSKNVFLMPMTIDPNRFLNSKSHNKYKKFLPYICLTFGTHNRDGIFGSIISYAKYLHFNPNEFFNLVLVGDFETLCEKYPENKEIIDYINNNNLQNKVHFIGKQPIDEVPEYLKNATCLITTAENYNSGGFPTKLGEYMLSGVPVIATNAGEISKYVTNDKDIFLCRVRDYDCIGKRILFIQDNYDIGRAVATQAEITAKTTFNAVSYIKDLLNFCEHVKKN